MIWVGMDELAFLVSPRNHRVVDTLSENGKHTVQFIKMESHDFWLSTNQYDIKGQHLHDDFHNQVDDNACLMEMTLPRPKHIEGGALEFYDEFLPLYELIRPYNFIMTAYIGVQSKIVKKGTFEYNKLLVGKIALGISQESVLVVKETISIFFNFDSKDAAMLVKLACGEKCRSFDVEYYRGLFRDT
jgi:hypothetical protein